MKFEKALVIGAALTASLISAQAQYTSGDVINGNGNTGFGGPVGLGNLVLTDDGTDLTVTLNAASALGSPGQPGNDLVIYLDTFAGGFSSTASFTDDSDGGRIAVSGYDGPATDQQSVLTFASGFTPDFAIDIGNTYASLYGLVASSDLDYITGASQNSASPYSLTIPLSDLGVIEGSGESFQFFGTLISETAYRSTEAIAGTDSGTQGNNPFTDLTYATYTTVATPEPSTLALGAVSGLAMLLARRRK